MSLADYLAQNYLTKDDSAKKTKKRKRKAQAGGNVIIADDDILGWDEGKGKSDEEDEATGTHIIDPQIPHLSYTGRKKKKKKEKNEGDGG